MSFELEKASIVAFCQDHNIKTFRTFMRGGGATLGLFGDSDFAHAVYALFHEDISVVMASEACRRGQTTHEFLYGMKQPGSSYWSGDDCEMLIVKVAVLLVGPRGED